MLGGAIAIALAFGATTPASVVADSASYLDPARAWAGGWGLSEIDGRPLQGRLPAYPFALGLLIRLFGESRTAFTLLNVVFHLLAVLAVHAGTGVILKGRGPLRDGIAALAIVYPPLLTSTAFVLQESLLALLLALCFLLAVYALDKPSTWRSLLAGASLGLACLAKATALPLLIPLAVALWRVGKPSLGRGLLSLVGLALVTLPWAVHNHAVAGRFELTNNNGGFTLLGGTVSNTLDWRDFPEMREAMARWDAGEKYRYSISDRFFYRVALERIQADPLRWSRLVAGRVLRFVLPARGYFVAVGRSRLGSFGPWQLAAIAVQIGLFASMLWLAWRALRDRGPLACLVAPTVVLVHWAVYALTFVQARYGVTVGPVLFGCLTLAVAMADDRAHHRR